MPPPATQLDVIRAIMEPLARHGVRTLIYHPNLPWLVHSAFLTDPSTYARGALDRAILPDLAARIGAQLNRAGEPLHVATDAYRILRNIPPAFIRSTPLQRGAHLVVSGGGGITPEELAFAIGHEAGHVRLEPRLPLLDAAARRDWPGPGLEPIRGARVGIAEERIASKIGARLVRDLPSSLGLSAKKLNLDKLLAFGAGFSERALPRLMSIMKPGLLPAALLALGVYLLTKRRSDSAEETAA